MTYYVAMDIGCIECWEDSCCLGIFTSEAAARAVLEENRKRQEADWTGDHQFAVYEVGALDQELPGDYS